MDKVPALRDCTLQLGDKTVTHTHKEDRGEAPWRSTGVSGTVIPQGSRGAEAFDVGCDNGQVEAQAGGHRKAQEREMQGAGESV